MNQKQFSFKTISKFTSYFKNNFLNFIRRSLYKTASNYKVSSLKLKNNTKFVDREITNILEYIPVYGEGTLTLNFSEKKDYFAKDLIADGVTVLDNEYYLLSLRENESIEAVLTIVKKFYREDKKYFPFSTVTFNSEENTVTGYYKTYVLESQDLEIKTDLISFLNDNYNILEEEINKL